MLISAVGSAVTLTARGFPDASTWPASAAWVVGGRPAPPESGNGPQIAGRMREEPHAQAHHLPSLQGS